MATSPIRLDDVIAPDQGERKFVLDAETACVVWRVIGTRLKPQHREQGRPLTYHRTTYFDTPELGYYRGGGALARRLRVREYATAKRAGEVPELNESCFLELKHSAGGLRAKTRVEVSPREVTSELAKLGGTELSPCLTTWYQRAALTDPEERLRVTLDSRLMYCKPRAVGAPCDGEPLQVFARGPAYILEVKAWGELPAWMVLMLRGLRENSTYSKFRGGMREAELRGLLPSFGFGND
jgi:hypothetical protein